MNANLEKNLQAEQMRTAHLEAQWKKWKNLISEAPTHNDNESNTKTENVQQPIYNYKKGKSRNVQTSRDL